MLLGLVVAACGSPAAAPTATPGSANPLRSVQLRTADVPADFYRAGTSVLTPNQAAQTEGVDPAAYIRVGGGSAVAEHFVLHHPATMGITFIASEVFSFSSAGAASAGFRLLRAGLAHSGTVGTVQETVDIGATPTPLPTIVNALKHPVRPPPTLYTPIRIPALGLEDAGFTNASAAYAGEFVFTNQVVLFRESRYCAVVHVSGDYAQVPLSAALMLARRIDGRMRAISSSS